MEFARALLSDSPTLRLFLVVGLGYLFGLVEIRGASLGLAGVLFAGVLLGAWGGPEFALPEVVASLGLAVFMYTLGIHAGPEFFKAFRAQGLRLTALTLAALALGAAAAAVLSRAAGLSGAMAAGIFCGALTNTPALGSVLEQLRRTLPPGDPALASPAIGYSVAYPFGALGVAIALRAAVRIFGIDLARERREHDALQGAGAVYARSIAVTKPLPEAGIADAAWAMRRTGVVITRHRRAGETRIATPHTVLVPGDAVLAVGTREALDRATALLGEEAAERLDLGRPDIGQRRILVTNRDAVGKRIGELDLPSLGAVITRVRRGDVELAGHPDTVLEFGDRVRVVAYEDRFDAVTDLLGDSLSAIREADFLPLAVGLSAGVLAGLVPLPLPGGLSVRLGTAGGPLFVALLLGRLGKTGRWIWSLPTEVNFTLRQFGLLLFLAAVGLKAGGEIVGPLGEMGLSLFGIGCAVTLVVAAATLALGRFALRANAVELFGMLPAVHTQPAALAVATRLTGSDATSLAYARVHPIATVAKILLAQALVALLGP
ncbi:MAG: aspartate:alanine exchanger family transporter [Planctomycetota bacterium]